MSRYQKIILAFLLIVGTVIQVIPTIRSGLSYPFGYGFWGPSGHDSIWHLSLISHISNPLDIRLPIFSGDKLVNYHPFFDILIALVSHSTHISPSLWLFQIFPILSSLVILYLSYLVGKTITKSHRGGLILLSLNSIANSLGWIISLFRGQGFGGETIFWAMQSPSNQINPPYALSLIFILFLLLILYRRTSKQPLSKSDYFFIFIILVLSPLTKAYSAVVTFGIYGLFSLYQAHVQKRYSPFVFLVFSTIIAAACFLYYNPHASSVLAFQPFWFINSMIESPDRVYLPHLANMRYAGFLNHNYFKLFIASAISLAIFIAGNFGWRLIGLYALISKKTYLQYTLLTVIVITTLIPIFFVQQGTSWNTIQFMYYALFLSNIFMAQTIDHLFTTNTGKAFTLIIFITYILSFLGNVNNYLGKIPPSALPIDEINALNFLSRQAPGIVLTAPYDQYLKNSFAATPIPLYAYETTAYVSAFSKHYTYLEDEMNLNNSGYNFQSRHQLSVNFFKQTNVNQDRGFLIDNNIKYIYLAGKQQEIYTLDQKSLYLTMIYQTPGATIYQVQR